MDIASIYTSHMLTLTTIVQTKRYIISYCVRLFAYLGFLNAVPLSCKLVHLYSRSYSFNPISLMYKISFSKIVHISLPNI